MLLLSIKFKNLLYLNLAPNLFNSVEFAYALILDERIVFTSSEEDVKFEL